MWKPSLTVLSLVLVSALATQRASAEPGAPVAPFAVPTAADGVQRATVMLDSYSYQPSHLIVEVRKPVELTLTSVTTITPHNFIIKDLAPAVSVERDVKAAKTEIVTFTPTQPGTFTIYCDKRLWRMPSHRDRGME